MIFYVISLFLMSTAALGQFVEESLPEGFEDLPSTERTLVDVTFAGRNVGSYSAEFSYSEGWIKFKNPAAIVRDLPALKAADKVAEALSLRLASNSDKLCPGGKIQLGCGHLSPSVLGVIFDPSTFKAQIFINPRLISPRGHFGPKYLDPANLSFSSLTNLQGALNKSTDQEANSQLDLEQFFSYGPYRLTSQILYNNQFQNEVQYDQIAAEYDGQKVFASVGLLNSLTLSLLPQKEILGGTIQTNLNTRRDIEQSRANELTLFLNRTSQVILKRKTELLDSRLYPPGLQIIDTSGFPEGAYYIDIQINEYGGISRSERKFFIKLNTFPPRDTTVFRVDAGFLQFDRNEERAAVEISSRSFLGGSILRRVGENLAVKLGTTVFNDEVSALAGTIIPYVLGDLEWDFLYTSEKVLGTTFQNRFFLGDFNLSSGLTLIADKENRNTSFTRNILETNYQDTIQMNHRLDYFLKKIRMSLKYDFNKTTLNRREVWNLSAAYQSFLTRHIRSFVQGEISRVDYQEWVFSLNLQLNWDYLPGLSFFGSTSYQENRPDDGEKIKRTPYEIGHQGVLANKNYNVAGTVSLRDDDPTRTLNFRSNLDSTLGRARGFFNRTLKPEKTSTYGGNFGFQLAVAESGATFGGKARTAGAVIIKIDSDEDLEFDVYVDQQLQGTVKPSRQLLVSLPPYQEYSISLREQASDLAEFDNNSKKITLYPGHVEVLNWKVSRQLLLLSLLVDEAGQPLLNYRADEPYELLESDSSGWIQGEIKSHTKTIRFMSDKGRECEVSLPNLKDHGSIFRPEVLTCESHKEPIPLRPFE